MSSVSCTPLYPIRVFGDNSGTASRTPSVPLSRAGWLARLGELRVGLGCMRLSTDEGRDEEPALETIAAAARAGVTVFDTARAYARDATELGHNERLLARGAAPRADADAARGS